MLNEEDTPLHTRHRNSHRPVLLTSDSSSDGEGGGEAVGEGEGEGEGSPQSNTQDSENAVPDELSGTKPFPMVPRSKLLSFAYRKSQLSANSVEERMSVDREMESVDDEEEIGGGCEEERRGGVCEEGREPVDGEEEIEGGCEEGGYMKEKEALINNTTCSATELADSAQQSCDVERGEHELITTTVSYMYMYTVWTYM